MFGYSRHELVGKEVEILVPKELRDVHRLREGYSICLLFLKLFENLRSCYGKGWMRPFSSRRSKHRQRETDAILRLISQLRDAMRRNPSLFWEV
jgi:hypothetical protein